MKYLIVALLFLSSAVPAVEITTTEGISISAINLSANLAKEENTYEGEVVVKQNGMEFRADKVIEYRKDKVLLKLVATGSPNVFIDRLATENQIKKGKSKLLVYTSDSATVDLQGYELVTVLGSSSAGNSGLFILDK